MVSEAKTKSGIISDSNFSVIVLPACLFKVCFTRIWMEFKQQL